MKALFTLTILFSVSALASGWEDLVKNLSQTRAEVESLSKEMESLQKEKQSELDQWTQRQSELEAQVQKEKLRRLQIDTKVAALQSRVRQEGKVDPQGEKYLAQWLDESEKWVKQSIPFQQDRRLRTLSGLKERLKQRKESLEFIMTDLWTFLESEMKMAQTHEFAILDIEIEGKTRKAELARIGVQSLFALTPDGKSWQAMLKNETWQWTPVSSSDEESSIQLLVKNLKNKNHAGYYTLPFHTTHSLGASL